MDNTIKAKYKIEPYNL